MLSIILFCNYLLYNYIHNYIFLIPLGVLYLNYIKENKLNKFNFNKDNKINIIYKKINNKLNNLTLDNYKKFLINNYNNKLLYVFIKLDNIIICVTNEFLLFLLFYLKISFQYIISSQINNKFKNNSNSNNNLNNRKHNLINLNNKNN